MQGDAVDVLLNLRTSAGQRLVQVTVLVPKGAPKVQPAQLGTARPATGQAAGASVHVRRGDTLYNIAQRNPVAGANIHQMLVALWRANPNAFIGDNMNRLKERPAADYPDGAGGRAPVRRGQGLPGLQAEDRSRAPSGHRRRWPRNGFRDRCLPQVLPAQWF
jgi:pilus assembly protein FimV